ncbi:MAG TPA: glycogen debranching enzyme N-terminal domain-containing protein, partial [Tepidiformaceae bacterium]|nr:glycogen debranching enzyme N-terminal domain-containing protein [Tepidiformaceae bacterium]
MTDLFESPYVHLSRARCNDVEQSLGSEWLVTNGTGGYASGTVSGAATRRYHGTLVAALQAPVGRTVLSGPVDEWAVYAAHRWPISTHDWAGGTISPPGYRFIESFRLEGTIPVWTYAFADALLEKRIWMVHGRQTTLVRYTLVRGSADMELELRPLLTCRDFHALPSTAGWAPEVAFAPSPNRLTAQMFAGAPTVSIELDRRSFDHSPDWYRNFHFREEASRGFDADADLYCPGLFRASLRQGESATLAVSCEASSVLSAPGAADSLLAAESERQRALLGEAGVR